jgi:hypothetical protein
MSTYNINFQELFKSTFHQNIGFVGSAIIGSSAIGGAIIDKYANKFSGIEVLEEQKPLQLKSQTGAPVWDYVKLLPKVIDGTGEKFDGYQFPFECVVEAVLPKKIVSTDIFGSDGQVEELMGLDDWQINLKGFIINYDTDDYPEFEVRRLRSVCELKDTQLEVEGTFLNLLNVNLISLHRLSLPPSPGYKNMQAFEVECRSKKPFIIDADNGILL